MQYGAYRLSGARRTGAENGPASARKKMIIFSKPGIDKRTGLHYNIPKLKGAKGKAGAIR